MFFICVVAQKHYIHIRIKYSLENVYTFAYWNVRWMLLADQTRETSGYHKHKIPTRVLPKVKR